MGRLSEGVDVHPLPASARDAEVAGLTAPWIADEGPLEARFERRPASAGSDLHPRGIAFDRATTVTWDESGVTVVRAAPPRPGVVALDSPVLVRKPRSERHDPRFVARPPGLRRIDYLERGALVASRYTFDDSPGGDSDG